ncbi:hypothetical protein M5689_012999 [Euphorbia peplus]|nr:hypothetical protein M5689_012999 [Euphorbia peplus]
MAAPGPPGVEPDSRKSKPTRGRKPSKVTGNKKELKRGMGVFRLEQLRMAREAAETMNSQVLTDPFNDVQPMMLGFAQNQNLNQPSLGSFWINPYVYRVSSSASVYETSTELSSIPNIVNQTPSSDFCCCCKKKKKKKFINGEECTVYNVRKEHISEMSMSISGSDFQGLNLENNFQFYDQKRAGFNSRAARSALYSNNNNLAGGAEVVAVHSKMGRNAFMEYEFFPDGGKNGTFFEETIFQNPHFTAAGGAKATSCLTDFDYSAAAPTNSVDLSLKLSF